MSDIRVLIADDHPVVRAGLAALLSSLTGITVVDAVPDGAQAVEGAARHRPDVVILDLEMPVLGGLDALARIRQASPATAVLVLTMHDGDEHVLAALRAGARGYLVKGAEQDAIERAVRAVARGEAIFGADVTERALGLLTDPPVPEVPFPDLTDRERRILELVALGLPNPAIATRLGLATKTVANNVSTILVKLQVPDRAQAIIRAREAGLRVPSR